MKGRRNLSCLRDGGQWGRGIPIRRLELKFHVKFERMVINEHLRSHFLNLFLIAMSDNAMDTSELEVLFKIGKEHGVPKEDIEKLLLNIEGAEISVPEDTLTKVRYLYDFAQIILADGVVDDREKQSMKKFCEHFGFQEQFIPDIIEFLLEEGKKGTSREEVLEQVKQTF